MPTIHTSDIELHYEARGEGAPLLLLHGFLGSGGDFVHALDLDALARTHRLIQVDLRGHARSTNPAGTFTHRQASLDVQALLDELGVARVRSIGVSCGGNVLLHLARRQPERVEAMVLVSATTHYPPGARAYQRGFSLDAMSEAERRRLFALHGEEQARALVRCANAFADDHNDLAFTRAELAAVSARTLIVYGDRDPLYPVEIGVELYRGIPRAQLWVVPNGGHGPIFGGERAAFERAAISFLTAT